MALNYSHPLPFDLPCAVDREKPALMIGCGAVALEFHFPRIQALIRSPQLYLCEVDANRLDYLRHRWKTNPRVTPVNEVPEDLEFSLVLIATPPRFHAEYYVQVADVADSILIEKPITISVKDAQMIESSSQAKKSKVFVNLIRRVLINYRLLREVYTSQQFGELRSVRVTEGGVFNWNAASMGSFSRDLNGGGVLMDTGPHTLDLLFQVFDCLKLVSSTMDAWGTERAIEANCVLHLTADDGVPVTVALSRNRNFTNTSVFEFEDAVLTLSVRDNHTTVTTREGLEYRVCPPGPEDTPPLPYPSFFDLFYEQFILPRNNRGVGPTESLAALRIIEAAYESAEPMEKSF